MAVCARRRNGALACVLASLCVRTRESLAHRCGRGLVMCARPSRMRRLESGRKVYRVNVVVPYYPRGACVADLTHMLGRGRSILYFTYPTDRLSEADEEEEEVLGESSKSYGT